jgi:hypothetical protein
MVQNSDLPNTLHLSSKRNFTSNSRLNIELLFINKCIFDSLSSSPSWPSTCSLMLGVFKYVINGVSMHSTKFHVCLSHSSECLSDSSCLSPSKLSTSLPLMLQSTTNIESFDNMFFSYHVVVRVAPCPSLKSLLLVQKYKLDMLLD